MIVIWNAESLFALLTAKCVSTSSSPYRFDPNKIQKSEMMSQGIICPLLHSSPLGNVSRHHSPPAAFVPAGECLKASFAPCCIRPRWGMSQGIICPLLHSSPLGNVSRHHLPPAAFVPAGECLKASFAPCCIRPRWGMPQGIIRPPTAGECLKASFAPPPPRAGLRFLGEERKYPG